MAALCNIIGSHSAMPERPKSNLTNLTGMSGNDPIS